MTLIFPIKTISDIVSNYKKHTIEKKVEYIAPLCKDTNNRVSLGSKVVTGTSYGISGEMPQKDVCWDEWIGEIHSHTRVRAEERFVELDKGMSDDDVNHIISHIFSGNYKKFPVLFCSVTPTRDTQTELDIEVQCEKYEKIGAEDIIGMNRSAEPIYEQDQKIYKQYNLHSMPFTEKHVDEWVHSEERGGVWGYPFFYDLNKVQDEIMQTGDANISKQELGKAYVAALLYQGDMASIKKELKAKGLMTNDEFTIKCKKVVLGRKGKPILVCNNTEQKLNL